LALSDGRFFGKGLHFVRRHVGVGTHELTEVFHQLGKLFLLVLDDLFLAPPAAAADSAAGLLGLRWGRFPNRRFLLLPVEVIAHSLELVCWFSVKMTGWFDVKQRRALGCTPSPRGAYQSARRRQG